jgi:hypothetical protein
LRKDSGFRRALAEKYYSRDGPSDSDYRNIEKNPQIHDFIAPQIWSSALEV